jgi:flagellar FliL protein
VLAVAAVAGGGTGVAVVGPLLTHRASASEPASARAKTSHGEEAPVKLLELKDMIMNPAGSDGSRFLMISVAFEFSASDAELRARNRETELRDRIAAVLTTQTMGMLTAPGSRDSLKTLLAEALFTVTGSREPVRIFIPHLLIQ